MRLNYKTCCITFVALFAITFVPAFAENMDVKDYKKTFDNIPANWEQFYLDSEQIDAGKGEQVNKVYMTRHTYGQSGDATLLAGGHWFTVIGRKHILIKDEDEETFLIETRGKCRIFKRLKHLYLGNNEASLYYRKNGSVIGMTRFQSGNTTGSPYGSCDIDKLYRWSGPTYFLSDIKSPVRNYSIPNKRRDRSDPLLARVGR